MKRYLALLLSSLFAMTAHSEPPNLYWQQTTLLSYHDSGRYDTELNLAVGRAREYLAQRINAKKQQDKPLAIMLDVDETSISNYPTLSILLKMFNQAGAGFPPDEMNVLNHPFDAPVIKSTLALFNFARQHHVSVFFVTGRPERFRKGTSTNLTKAGYHHWQALYLRQPNQIHWHATKFKAYNAKKITQQGYDLVLTMGDQFSDLVKAYSDAQFKLPNPYYYIP